MCCKVLVGARISMFCAVHIPFAWDAQIGTRVLCFCEVQEFIFGCFVCVQRYDVCGVHRKGDHFGNRHFLACPLIVIASLNQVRQHVGSSRHP